MKKTQENTEQIVIVGAGVAGLSLAILLAERNIPCIVIEKRENFGNSTSGVLISAEGARVLESMGIDNIGETTENLDMYFGKGTVAFKIKREKNSSLPFIVTRLAIFEKLQDRINQLGIPVVYNFALEDVYENTSGIVAVANDGQRIQGKYLVGADGVGSNVRKLLNPDSNADKRYAGYLGIGFIFPSEKKENMSLYYNTNGNVGLASIGKISQIDDKKNNFLWRHIHMPEEQARVITDKEVYDQMMDCAKSWPPYLQERFQELKSSAKTVLYHLPVYNGSIPDKWYSDRILLIGDAAHPYGPGGHGISMAMLDAEALCKLFVEGPTELGKLNFQTTQSALAKSKGESAENKNKPEKQVSTKLGLMFRQFLMRMYHFYRGGQIEF